MSALAARLRELRAQSGQPSAAPPPKPALAPDVLRLIRGRSRMQGVAQHATSCDRMVPGVEIAPGLFLTEAIMDWGRPAPLIDTTFARWEEPVAQRRLLHFDTERNTATSTPVLRKGEIVAGTLISPLSRCPLAVEADVIDSS